MLPEMVPIVQLNVLGAVAVRGMFGLAPLQMTAVVADVSAGVGFTVTVIVKAGPGHVPTVEVGVTRYSTDPATALLGLVSIWLIRLPEPPLAPVIPPKTVPIVHEKLLDVLAVSEIFGLVPLQIVAVGELVTTGVGLTVTTILRAVPGHEPVTDVGVTRYSTVPEAELPGLVRTWFIAAPELLLAPVIPPVIVPTVHVNVLGVLAVSAIFGLVPLHVDAVAGVVTAGVGFTVTMML